MSAAFARSVIGRVPVARAVPKRALGSSLLREAAPRAAVFGAGSGRWGQGGEGGQGGWNRGGQGNGFQWSRLACGAGVTPLLLHKLARPALAEESAGGAAVAQAGAAATPQDKAANILEGLLESLRALLQDIVDKVRRLLEACRERVPLLAADAAEWAKAVQKALGERLEQASGLVESAGEGVKSVAGGAQCTGEAAAEAAAGAEGVPAKALQEQPPLAVSHWDTRYKPYYPLFVMGAVIGGMLGFLLLRRTRDAEYAKMAAQGVTSVKGVKTAGGVKGGNDPHPRRASPGGPLQESEVAAAVVKEVLDVVKVNDQVSKALGGSLKEGRMNVRKQNKNSTLKGDFGLMGSVPQAHGKVIVEAVKGPNNTWRCTTIAVKLPGITNPLVIPLEAPPAEDAEAAEEGGEGKK